MINFKKVFALVILINLIALSANIFTVNAIEREYGGPKTVEEAKKRFFKGQKLDIIEGIWYQEQEGAMYAVVKKRQGVYEIWTIEHKISKYNGTRDKHEGLRKTASEKIYAYKTTVYNIANPSEEAEGHGDWILENENFIESHITTGCWSTNRCWTPIYSYYIRVWPENIDSYNLTVTNKNEKVERSKPKTQYKDYWWVVVLLGLLAFFLYVTTVKKSKIKIKKRTQKKDSEIKKILKPYWQGKVSYGYSFWIYLTLLNGVLSIPAMYLGYGLTDSDWNNMSDIALAGAYIYFIFLLAAKIYFIVGTWRSAENYKVLKKRKKQGAAWAYIGQFYIILSIIRGVMMMVNEF